MNASALARAFRSILARSAPVLVLAGCSESTTASQGAGDATSEQTGQEPDSMAPGDTGQPETLEASADASDADAPSLNACDADLACGACSTPCDNAHPTVASCQGRVVALEAGAIDAVAGSWDGGWILGDPFAYLYDASTPCSTSFGCTFPSCKPFEDGGNWFAQCVVDCTGRRPAQLAPAPRASGTPLAAYFASMAHLEAASVHAFRHLRRQLVAHGAPRRLVRAAERAARDEIRHARMTTALARRHGSVPLPVAVGPMEIGTLEAMALENAVEGCTREAFGALVATWQAQAAEDPHVRAALTRIARDETRHAALAFQVRAWLDTRLDGAARARVRRATRAALEELSSREVEAPEALRRRLGLPSASQARVLAQELGRLAA